MGGWVGDIITLAIVNSQRKRTVEKKKLWQSD